MNIKRALRIAKEQAWFKSFKEYVNSEHGAFENYIKKNFKGQFS